MLAQHRNSTSKVSWTPFYYITSIVLASAQLNYFSNRFADRLWKKVLLFSLFFFQIVITLTCFIGIFLPNQYDLEDVISCLIIVITEVSIILKAMTLIYYSTLLKKLSDIIIGATSRDDLKPWELVLAKKYYKVSRLICIKIVFLYFLTMASFIAMPLLSEKTYAMPILMEFPGINGSGHPGYEINYILGSYGVFYGTTIEMGFDIPAFMQACFISFQLDRCVHYSNMIGDFDSAYNTQEKQSKLLIKCIQLHASIFEFIKHVARINTFVVALTVVTTVPLLTVLMYYVLLVGIKSPAPCLMIACAYHLFLYCFLGEVVSNKCHEASNAIYNSQWYRIKQADEQRTLLFFLTVSQCDMRFSAGGLYNLSLETFTELMKRVYGAYAFLKEVL